MRGVSWFNDAACRGMNPDLFFPELGEAIDEAVSVCAECPVRAECLEYALTENQWAGVWGGLSGRRRRELKRRRGHPTIACHVCGTLFKKRSGSHKTCSDACAITAQRTRQHEWEVRRRA